MFSQVLVILADQEAPRKPDEIRTEQRIEPRFRREVGDGWYYLRSWRRIKRTYRVTREHIPEHRRLWGYVYDAQMRRFFHTDPVFGHLVVNVPRVNVDPPWDLFSGEIERALLTRRALPSHPLPILPGALRHSRPDGGVEEAVELLIVTEDFSERSEVVDDG